MNNNGVSASDTNRACLQINIDRLLEVLAELTTTSMAKTVNPFNTASNHVAWNMNLALCPLWAIFLPDGPSDKGTTVIAHVSGVTTDIDGTLLAS